MLLRLFTCSTEMKLTLLKTFCSPMHTAYSYGGIIHSSNIYTYKLHVVC